MRPHDGSQYWGMQAPVRQVQVAGASNEDPALDPITVYDRQATSFAERFEAIDADTVHASIADLFPPGAGSRARRASWFGARCRLALLAWVRGGGCRSRGRNEARRSFFKLDGTDIWTLGLNRANRGRCLLENSLINRVLL